MAQAITDYEDGSNKNAVSFSSSRGISQGIRVGRQPQPYNPPKLDPVKEWEKVRSAWNDDVDAWQRYSGFKLPSNQS
jgi:hypothetical protein